MITKERIEQQDGSVLAVNPFGDKVAAKVVGYSGKDLPLVKFRCLFEAVAVPYSKIFPVPIPEELEEDYDTDISFSDTSDEDELEEVD